MELRKAIAASGQSIYATAQAAGVRPEMIARFVSGERDLRLNTAAKIAAALKLSLRSTSTKRKAAR